jgi:hypothetical protein
MKDENNIDTNQWDTCSIFVHYPCKISETSVILLTTNSRTPERAVKKVGGGGLNG